VDDLMLVVQGADEFARATGAGLKSEHREEVASLLRRLKEGCQRMRQQAVSSALATDKILHQYPYSFIGFAFAAGLLMGVLAARTQKG
jgi:ElaB/YqjD/DUF883 family membrane-anchored ribosome-binding protein